MVGTAAAGYNSAEHFMASTERPPFASKVESFGQTDLSNLLGFRVFWLQHWIVLAEIFASVKWIGPFSGLEVPSHGIGL